MARLGQTEHLRGYHRAAVVYVSSDALGTPVVVPVEIVRLLIPIRGGLPDHPSGFLSGCTNRQIMKAGGTERLFSLLKAGTLLVEAAEFDTWYRSQQALGKWPSQRQRTKRGRGRPIRQTDRIRNAILACVNDGAWTASSDSIADLERKLGERGQTDVPSPDTLARLVDRLFAETSNSALRRKSRARPSVRTD